MKNNRRFQSLVSHVMAAVLVLWTMPAYPKDDIDIDGDKLEALGRAMDHVLQHDYIFLADARTQGAIEDILRRLTASGDQLSTNYSVYLLNSVLPNAFASPSGSIYVTTGLLDSLQDEAELAFVLAHQISHVEGADSYAEFAKVHSKRNKIMWGTFIAMGVITIATLGAMASAGAALNTAGVSAAQASGMAALNTVAVVSTQLTQIENSRIRFAKAGIQSEPAHHPVFAPALFSAMHQSVFDGHGVESETRCNIAARELLVNAGFQFDDIDFFANRIGGASGQARVHMTTYTRQLTEEWAQLLAP